MKNLAHRPLLLPAALVIMVTAGSVCFPGRPGLLAMGAGLVVGAGFFACRRACPPEKSSWRWLFFLLFLLFSLLLALGVYCRVQRRLAAYGKLVREPPASRRTPRVFSGVVVAFPVGYGDHWRLLVAVAPPGVSRGGPEAGRVVQLRLPAASYDDARLPLVGDRVRVRAAVRPYRLPKNRFLAAANYDRRLAGPWHFATLATWRGLTIVRRGAALPCRRAVDRWRRWLYGRLARAVPDPQLSGLLQALLLGTRDALAPKLRELFLDLGVFHLLAISGLHVGIVAGFVFLLAGWLLHLLPPAFFPAGPRRPAALAAVAACWFYVLLTGMHLPALRAGIMATVFLAAIFLEVADDPPGSLLVAVLVILVVWPQALFQLSFQLSVAAVAAILLVLPVHRRCLPWLDRLPEKFSPVDFRSAGLIRGWNFFCRAPLTAFLVGAAAWLATFPLLLSKIHFFSPYGLAGNLLLVPVFSLFLIPAGFLALLLLPLPGVGSGVMGIYACLLREVVNACLWFQALRPRWRWSAAALTPGEILLYYAFWLLLLALVSGSRRRRLLPVLGLVVVLAAAVGDWAWWYDQRHHPGYVAVTCFTGGSPPAALVELPGGEVMLINGGVYPRQRFSLARYVIAPFCWGRKINRIDYLVLTAPQRGAVAGLDYLVRNFAVREVWYNGLWSGYPPFRNFYAFTRRQGIRWKKLSRLSRPRSFPAATLEVLAPEANLSRPLPPWKDLLAALAPGFRLVCGRAAFLCWSGSREELGRLRERRELGIPEVLLWCGRQAEPPLWPPPGRPRLTVVDRFPAAAKAGASRAAGRFWQLREDGCLSLRLYADGRLCVDR